MKKINQQALQCGECGYAHAAQLKQYRLISLGGVEKKLPAVLLTGTVTGRHPAPHCKA
ncbi:hypothetical protein [Klebsiella pneumoniae]|uniref:hypothetical protein n=1 Tax=Klebsiella pneumoniae TaxID=573 RepID=UPI002731E755|nr:hypothetical protein [Klebsiella pneumoniae]EJD6651209.1 hypothetical protein [Raoultella ornithinolytica]ELV3661881.1 hypothetical protein [Raoultella ornithinolytica]MDP0689784.1 hypothetical protein [Klebsiella pneumoniae]MDP0770291.1 hypothetical protein [Klebsiella pneumoniae]